MTVRILHTSDVHADDSPTGVQAVAALVDLALAREVDAMVIVGDFFDHNRVEAAAGQAVVDELTRLPVPVVVLPGNHDPLMAGTVYERLALPSHVRLIVDGDGETVVLDGLDVEIWGKPHLSYDDNRPLAGLPPRGTARWQVALAHGQLVQGSGDLHRSYLITREEIEASERDYVALGHWDVPRNVSTETVVACYSGSPSRKAVCALVTMAHDGRGRRVHVESISLDGSTVLERVSSPAHAAG
jgi:DNA repair exonuclease SbcCD nuclease subunit